MTEIISPIPSPLLDRPTSFHSHTHTHSHPHSHYSHTQSHTPGSMSSSRPLSEISENEDHRRSTARRSRPNSEVRELMLDREKEKDKEKEVKRLSAPSLPVTTISLNLNEYASAVGRSSAGGSSTTPTHPNHPSITSTASTSASTSTAPPPSFPPVSAAPGLAPPIRSEIPAIGSRTVSMSSIKEVEVNTESRDDRDVSTEEDQERHDDASALLQATRASLRPAAHSINTTYADVTKPVPSPPPSSSSVTSLDSPRSSLDKPPPKAKPSWLRRASGTAALSSLRSKSKSPVQKDESTLTASSSLPPLPPRKGSKSTRMSLGERLDMPPPEMTSSGHSKSYATIVSANSSVAGSGRSKLGEGQGRPAYSPAPPPLPLRENTGNIRHRIAAWTSAAQSSSTSSTTNASAAASGSTSLPRSESSASVASMAPSTFSQRIPSSAQRVIGTAGSAVSKGWAGLRARGVGGSISSMSGLTQGGRNASVSGSSAGSLEASGSWGSGLGRSTKERERRQSGLGLGLSSGSGSGVGSSAAGEFGAAAGGRKPLEGPGPVFVEGVIRRKGDGRTGRVFGRELVDVGKAWGVVDVDVEGDEMETRRRACLPALVVRAVDYLEIWGPKEEGIFRISGRSSHIARLRKEFDGGADLDLRGCHPGDLDPHAVAGVFKSYLRELPSPLLTTALTPRFEMYVRNRHNTASSPADSTGLQDLLQQLPTGHWFLLADVVKLLDLIPRHSNVNRMTLNALMLSLGPSLNIAGGVLTELIAHRRILFSSPPDETNRVGDMIDFGDTSISPPMIPVDQQPTGQSRAAQLPERTDSPVGAKAKRIGSRPSLTRLFTAGSAKSAMSPAVVERPQTPVSSIVDAEPPRVELPLSPIEPLPRFSDSTPTSPAPLIENLPVPTEQPDHSETSMSHAGVDVARPTATATVTATPIADKFSGTSNVLPSLRGLHNSLASSANLSPSHSLPSVSLDSTPATGTSSSAPIGTTNSNANVNTNPATVVRRGQPVFFSSAGVNSRSSGTSTPPGTGVRQRDSLQSLHSFKRSSGLTGNSAVASNTGEMDEEERKRASTGSGGSRGSRAVSVRDMVRGMEMAA